MVAIFNFYSNKIFRKFRTLRFKEKPHPPHILYHLQVTLRLAPERCGERDSAKGSDAKSATTGQRNIIRIRVHQPGKQKDIYIHKAHLLNMIVFTVDIKIVDIQKVYNKEIKKERDYIACVCMRVCVCMDKRIYRVRVLCFLGGEGGIEGKKRKNS